MPWMRNDAVRINSAPRFYLCEPNWSWSPPPLLDYDLWCVLDGAGGLVLDGTRYALRPYVCFVLSPGSRIQAHHDLRHRLRVFAVHFDLPRGPVPLPPPGLRVQDGVFLTALARQCVAAWRMGSDLSRQQATGLIGQMLLHLWTEAQRPVPPAGDTRMATFVAEILEDPGRHWSVSELARKAGLSRAQFSRLLTKATGMSPERFLIQARIDRAKQLLRETGMTISQIADALGYRDVFYFSRQFASVAGQTATGFRHR